MDRSLGAIEGFCELVAAGVKPLALSPPLTPEEAENLLPAVQKIAEQYGVEMYRETDLLVTDLFPAEVAEGKVVFLFCQGLTLDAYEALKADQARLEAEGAYTGAARERIARRFGRLLGYSPAGINRLLAQNTDFRTMSDFGVRAGNVFLYYQDLPRAVDFYANTLGLEPVADYQYATIFRLAADAYLTVVDVAYGMHGPDEPKTVAIALLTDQLDEWWTYLQERETPIKYEYKPKEGGAHDGFVAVDPEGYLLEFERFKQHPENERFMPWLDRAETIPATATSQVPPGLGFKGMITWLYYKDVLGMQGFYEQTLGLPLVADQGWTKIYRLAPTSFIGLVDECRGMHDFTEEKAVTVSFLLDDLDGWFDYVSEHEPFPLRSDTLETDPEGRYRAFVGYDPAGYFMEFDVFLGNEDNERLLELLNPAGKDDK